MSNTPDLLPAHRDKLVEVLADPDMIRRSVRADAATLFSRWYTGKPGTCGGRERMASKLTLRYDRDADILYITSHPPYPEQETEELGDDIIARLNPHTGLWAAHGMMVSLTPLLRVLR